MRLLKLPNSRFHRVAYAAPQSLLTTVIRPDGWSTRLWDLAQNSESAGLTPQQQGLAHLLFKPGGSRLLSAHGIWTDGKPPPVIEPAARIWDVLEAEKKPGWEPFAFGPDGETVLYRHAGHIDNAYRTHFHLKTPDGTVHDLFREWGMFTSSAAFSPNGRLVAMSNGMRVVAVWDAVERKELHRLGQSDKTNAVAFVSDEHLVAAAGRSVQLWDVNTGRSVSKFRAFRKYADALAVPHDLKLFAAGDRDGVVRVWDVASGREVKEYEWGIGSVRDLAFSPDGATAAAAGVSAVAVWDVD